MPVQPNGSPAKAQLPVEKPTIKILLYTDDAQFSESKSFDQFLGLGLMIERLKGHEPTFATIETKLVNRSTATHADNKLDAVLAGESFDEIWFFGAQQGNTSNAPQSELDASEVAALTNFMKGNAADGSEGGGILMTGDHANETPADFVASPNGPCGNVAGGVRFLGLGRAIGHCVPRAGMLRGWEGPPTFRSTDSFNTLAGDFGFQMDQTPQNLLLENVNENGEPDPNGQPHPLFFYRQNRFITVFPDHGHEGEVITPANLDASWPTGPNGQTRPHIVARSRTRTQEVINTIAAYNGDLAGVGRIVADSTWHHYTNLNLLGFPHPAPEGSAADQIGQFYANLAIWLAPLSKRRQMGQAMSLEIARDKFMQELGGDIDAISDATQSLVQKATLPCEARELTTALREQEAKKLRRNLEAVQIPRIKSN